MKTNSFRKMLLLVLFCVLIIPTIGTATAKYSNQIQLNEISLNIIGDSTPPVLTLSVPDKTDSITYTVTGTVSDDVGVQSVKVNGVDATITGNTWSAEITLSDLTVTAVATDVADNETTETITYQEFTVDSTNRVDLGYTDDTTDLVIPATFYNEEDGVWQKVTAIGDYAFSFCNNLTSVTIPDSVTTIGIYAFGESRNLTSMTIPDSVTTIGDAAFVSCLNLTSVTIPDGVTTIGNEAFSCCTSLTSITFEHTNEDPIEIAAGAFELDSYVKTTITATNDYILNTYDWISDNRALAAGLYQTGTSTLIKDWDTLIADGDITVNGTAITGSVWDALDGDLVIKNSITSINGFSMCGLTSVTIPGSVTTIGNSAFLECRNLTSVTIPGSVTTIGNSAFWACTGLTSVTIPNSVTTIDSSAFAECSNLTSVTIGDSVTTIGDYAFAACSNLTSVTIPDSVTTIGSGAFAGSSKLSSAVFKNTNGWWVSEDSNATSGTSVTVTDASTAANNLTDTYCYYYWKRS